MRLTTSPSTRAECHGNLGAETSRNPLGHTGPVTGLLYLLAARIVKLRNLKAQLTVTFEAAK